MFSFLIWPLTWLALAVLTGETFRFKKIFVIDNYLLAHKNVINLVIVT